MVKTKPNQILSSEYYGAFFFFFILTSSFMVVIEHFGSHYGFTIFENILFRSILMGLSAFIAGRIAIKVVEKGKQRASREDAANEEPNAPGDHQNS